MTATFNTHISYTLVIFSLLVILLLQLRAPILNKKQLNSLINNKNNNNKLKHDQRT